MVWVVLNVEYEVMIKIDKSFFFNKIFYLGLYIINK